MRDRAARKRREMEGRSGKFWLGDLNYRIDAKRLEVTKSSPEIRDRLEEANSPVSVKKKLKITGCVQP